MQKTITFKIAFSKTYFIQFFQNILNSISSSVVKHVSAFSDGIFSTSQLADTTVIEVVPIL